MTPPDVIAGVDRISHEAIEDFVRRANDHLDARPTTAAFLEDAVTNLRQLLAEYAVMRTGIEEIIKDFGPDFLRNSPYDASVGTALMRDALSSLLDRSARSKEPER